MIMRLVSCCSLLLLLGRSDNANAFSSLARRSAARGLSSSLIVPPLISIIRTPTTRLLESINVDDDKVEANDGAWFISETLKDVAILTAPALMAATAFIFYTDTSKAFHALVDTASRHTWAPVDGGAYLTDLITPALNGPVTGVISILFGTLVSTTISNLYNRQATLSRLLADIADQIRMAGLHVEYFPEPYKTQAETKLHDFLRAVFEQTVAGDISPESFRSRQEMGQLISLFHQLSADETVKVPGNVLDAAYSTINEIIKLRSSLISTYENRFPVWHYGNLAVLASAICVIFLVLTDKTALNFLGGFQLRMCWSMLIGTFAMLGVVIYDLNTPLSRVFKVRAFDSLLVFKLLLIWESTLRLLLHSLILLLTPSLFCYCAGCDINQHEPHISRRVYRSPR